MSSEADLYRFRPYQPDDVAFIQSSWGHSYYEGGAGHQQLTPQDFHSYHRPIREKALNNPNVAAIVCVTRDAPETILGWILVEKPNQSPYIMLHYLYVKAAVQREGIGSELMKMALPIRPVLYTHSTIKARRIVKENWKAQKNTYDRFHFTPHFV